MQRGDELDEDTLNRIVQFADVIRIDGTIPEFFDNVDKAGITEMPWLIAFADKVPYYKGPYNERFDQEFGGKNQGYRDMLEALKAAETGQDDEASPPDQNPNGNAV